MIDVNDLVYEYPSARALDGVSLKVVPQTITALVGPNGAGKTTLLRCLAALEAPYAGHVLIDGLDTAGSPREIHARLGYLPDFYGLYDELSVRRSLLYARPGARHRPRRGGGCSGKDGRPRRPRRPHGDPGRAALAWPASAPRHRPDHRARAARPAAGRAGGRPRSAGASRSLGAAGGAQGRRHDLSRLVAHPGRARGLLLGDDHHRGRAHRRRQGGEGARRRAAALSTSRSRPRAAT